MYYSFLYLIFPNFRLERDSKLSELEERADALQDGSAQFEKQAGALKNKFWLENLKSMIAMGVVAVIVLGLLYWHFSAPAAPPAYAPPPPAAAPAPAALPDRLSNINGLSVTRQKPVNLPKDLRLPSGITLSHPRGIQNQPPPPRSRYNPPPAPAPVPETERKQKVSLELTVEQMEALKTLGYL